MKRKREKHVNKLDAELNAWIGQCMNHPIRDIADLIYIHERLLNKNLANVELRRSVSKSVLSITYKTSVDTLKTEQVVRYLVRGDKLQHHFNGQWKDSAVKRIDIYRNIIKAIYMKKQWIKKSTNGYVPDSESVIDPWTGKTYSSLL
jgi:hypothetical protein